MKVVISQPMFLPWAGLFNQILMADIYVHYDDAQFSKGSFLNRVQLKSKEQYFWLTMPVSATFQARINNIITLNKSRWKKKHLKTFKQIFSQRPFGKEVLNLIENIYFFETENLADFNINAIEKICNYLEIDRKFIKSSAIDGLEGSSSFRVCEILTKLGASEYITGHGAKRYLDHEMLESKGIITNYICYDIAPYYNCTNFTPYASVLDLISFKGKKSLENLNSRKKYWKDFIND
ncbi:MAG: hypothetical protein CMM87_03145 [Rickettsiales bacterium]|nr:hypothetical protein [Rickettsiales bacterium]|tara:strand:+ start:21750 stop:22457 length:708 start_codon:yes stop_codon:yes gene_type:complete